MAPPVSQPAAEMHEDWHGEIARRRAALAPASQATPAQTSFKPTESEDYRQQQMFNGKYRDAPKSDASEHPVVGQGELFARASEKSVWGTVETIGRDARALDVQNEAQKSAQRASTGMVA